jgi:endonuclease/exonuclease/phosphatase family metal-dependent hydrolase
VRKKQACALFVFHKKRGPVAPFFASFFGAKKEGQYYFKVSAFCSHTLFACDPAFCTFAFRHFNHAIKFMKSIRFSFRSLLILLVFSVPNQVSAQDTLRAMVYNLLHYGVSDAGCTTVPTATKNLYLKDIIGGAQPDILGVNEMGTSALYADNILINVLRLQDPDWQRCTYTNNASSNLVNMLFYRGDKLALYNEHVINHNLRDINVYTLYYLDPNLATTQDTAFLTFVVVHLKAGTLASDEAERLDQANLIMSYLNGLSLPGNLVIMGDFNLKSSSEASYQALITHSNLNVRFIDPINQPGSWNNNSAFEAIHTQSTRSGSLPDCGASGGMDDRFDFMLANRNVMGDSDKVKYVPASLKAYGNDNNHYNSSINSPANTAVSSAIANSLYNMSDHLPVIMDLRFEVSQPSGADPASNSFFAGVFPNPFTNQIDVRFTTTVNGSLRLIDCAGRELWIQSLTNETEVQLETASLPPGIYILEMVTAAGEKLAKKLVKTAVE